MNYQYQVIVVGSGSAGKEACLKAAKAGLRTLLIEDKTLGGTAYYAGSYAVRALRACASYLNQTEKASKAGTNLDLIESSWTNWMTSQRLSSGNLAIEFSNAIDHEKVDLKFGRARLVGPHEISLTDAQNELEVRITSGHIILATGSRPNFSSRPENGVLNSNQILREANPARHLFVIGGGYVGCELAAIYRSLGSRVTIAEAKPRLLPGWDPIAGEYFQKVLQKEGATVLLNEPIDPVPQNSTRTPSYKLSTGEIIRPDVTLVATGRQPNSDDLGLETVGLTSGDWIPVSERMQTAVDSIYAVGDVTGISLLDSVAAAQADVAVENILGNPTRFDKRWYSQFLHTDPPIANIGWSEDEALEAQLPIKVLNWKGSLFTDDDFTAIEREHMIVKCVIHAESNLFLGCIAIGSRAAEIINLVGTAIANRLSALDISKLSAVHPSATETLVRLLRNHFDPPLRPLTAP
jgi:dihydrolipoamide dehydrogenase